MDRTSGIPCQARRRLCCGAITFSALPGLAWAGDGGGNTDINIGESPSTAPKLRVSKIRLKDYYRMSRSEVRRALEKMNAGTKAYRLDGFSGWGTKLVLEATLIDSNSARELVRAMDKLTKREHRKKFLKEEAKRQDRKVKEIEKTARKLQRDANEAFKTSGDSDRAMNRYRATQQMADEETRRANHAGKYRNFVKSWARRPMEGAK